MTKKKIRVQFCEGEGKFFLGDVNYLLSKDGKIYAEVQVPDWGSDDYGYLAMVEAIQKEAKNVGLDLGDYEFWYDGQEGWLNRDAKDGEAVAEVKA